MIRSMRLVSLPALLLVLLALSACNKSTPDAQPTQPSLQTGTEDWTPAERALLKSLSIIVLAPPPTQPSNRVADNPVAAELGHQLFFNRSLSANGEVACATCHLPERLFTDGRKNARGIAATHRNTPGLLGAAHAPWLYWDGRRDSLWSQALAPLEAAAEMGSTRLAVVRHVTTHPDSATLYRRVFGTPPKLEDRARFPQQAGPFGNDAEKAAWNRMQSADRRTIDSAFANVGKAIAAYERLLQPGISRYDQYVNGLDAAASTGEKAILSREEIRGLRLFLDNERTICLRCHNGPLLSNHSFHHVGTADGNSGLPDFGRYLGIQAVLVDPFNCLGPFSDARPEQCRELRFIDKRHIADQTGKFKTPSLRGLASTGPYMHDGRFTTLEAVIEHYRQPSSRQPHELIPLTLDEAEGRALIAFLLSLEGGIDAPERWTQAPVGNIAR